MSKVLLNLQSDMAKVMTGINQLNILISNIQKYKANNNINNNMLDSTIMTNKSMMDYSIMRNNDMTGNNMINNNTNNMISNMINMNI